MDSGWIDGWVGGWMDEWIDGFVMLCFISSIAMYFAIYKRFRELLTARTQHMFVESSNLPFCTESPTSNIFLFRQVVQT